LVEPGETLQKSVKIVNDSSVAKTMYAYLMDFKSEGEMGKAKLIAPGSEKGYFLSSWIDITAEGVDFGPKEEREIFFTINVPADVGPGGYYGAVIFGPKPSEVRPAGEEKGAAVAVTQQVGALVLLQVAGDATEEAVIREFSTDKEFYSTPFSVNFLIRIENLGNVHIKPHGTIEISNMLGKEVAVVRVNDRGANVLPDSVRRFENSW